MKEKRLYLLFFCFCCSFLFMQNIYGQQNTWSGKIIDATTNEPLIGVSILIKESSTGTVSDFDGNFTFGGNIGNTVSITYVGYKPLEIKLTGKYDLGIIKLREDSETLEEVVVVGYGVQKKASLSRVQTRQNYSLEVRQRGVKLLLWY